MNPGEHVISLHAKRLTRSSAQTLNTEKRLIFTIERGLQHDNRKNSIIRFRKHALGFRI